VQSRPKEGELFPFLLICISHIASKVTDILQIVSVERSSKKKKCFKDAYFQIILRYSEIFYYKVG